MFPAVHAAKTPDKPAYIMGTSDKVVTYRELNDRSNRFAQYLWAQGLRPGDHIAIFLENHYRFLEVVWAAQRSGLYYTAINTHLKAPEVLYILNDCGASVLVTSVEKRGVAIQLIHKMTKVHTRLVIDGDINGYERYEDALDLYPATPLDEELEGSDMLYSSGITGAPKGIKRHLSGKPIGSVDPFFMHTLFSEYYRFEESSIYLSTSPLFHAAFLRYAMRAQRLGSTVVIMERFNPVEALKLIQRHRVTHSQWVPTMFVRMLKLPLEERVNYDLTSQHVVIHTAGPCPIPVKEQMIEWWGPIIYEYYTGTEANGITAISSAEWLRHKGSVGRALLGEVHIVGEDGSDLPCGESGTIYFANGQQFEYHNDPEKTAASHNEKGWTTLGDIGYVDEDGYLYLTDRKANVIISGGVNIYPQEIENVLTMHPKVMDVAVFGIPNEEFGEEVMAVVQPCDMAEADLDLEHELIDYCKKSIARYKCPRSIEFQVQLPRHPTGKLYKRLLKDRYWQGRQHQAY